MSGAKILCGHLSGSIRLAELVAPVDDLERTVGQNAGLDPEAFVVGRAREVRDHFFGRIVLRVVPLASVKLPDVLEVRNLLDRFVGGIGEAFARYVVHYDNLRAK